MGKKEQRQERMGKKEQRQERTGKKEQRQEQGTGEARAGVGWGLVVGWGTTRRLADEGVGRADGVVPPSRSAAPDGTPAGAQLGAACCMSGRGVLEAALATPKGLGYLW